MIQHSTYQWYAIRTKYKCEKYVRDLLLKQGVEAYVPILERKKRYVRKIKTYQLPLINCYAFVRISKEEYVQVLKTMHVVGFVQVAKAHLTAIPDAEIDMMKRVVGEKAEIELHPIELNRGDLVEIIGGNLTGIRGHLIERNGKSEFTVDLESIGFQMRMQIEERFLRKVQETALFA